MVRSLDAPARLDTMGDALEPAPKRLLDRFPAGETYQPKKPEHPVSKMARLGRSADAWAGSAVTPQITEPKGSMPII